MSDRRKRVSSTTKREITDNDKRTTMTTKKKKKEEARGEELLSSKTGGAYIPPAKLKMMQDKITDKSSAAYQRLAWEALKKSIHGLINKVNTSNIAIIVKCLFRENIVRGRGLLCRSLIQAQAASPTFTNVYAALAAVINSKFPNIGELLLKRCALQFKRSFRRNDKNLCLPSVIFIAHLVNQRVAHEITILEILTLLIENPTADSIEVAIAILRECGQKLTEVTPKGVNAIFETMRGILHEGRVEKRVQYMIEVIFQIRKDKFKDFPSLASELDLVDEEDQFTHIMSIADAGDTEDILNVFRLDEEYLQNEERYNQLKTDILGSDDEDDDNENDGDGSSSSEGSQDDDSDDDDDDDDQNEQSRKDKQQSIVDKTEAELIAFRRTIYLTINSSLDFEECAHKLLKMQFKPGDQFELCNMFIDCCAEQRTYEKFYGLLAERFCRINRVYQEPFEKLFVDSYNIVHRFDTNKLRNVAKFFAHLLFTDAISWEVLTAIHLNEEETTSSSRIFVKILFQELCEYMGLPKLNDRIKSPDLEQALQGLFPKTNPKDTRFAINFFTSIGLGGLTDDLREHLKAQANNF